MKKQGLLEISVNVVKAVLFVSLIFTICIYIYYGVINRADVLAVEPVRFIENWNVLGKDGTEYAVGRGYVDEKAYYKDIVIRSTLPEDVEANEYLFFYTRKDVAVYVNGELRDDFVEERDVNIPGGSVKSFYLMIPLKESDAGAEIKIIRSSSINDGLIVAETFISTRFGAFAYMMQNGGLSFILSFIVLIFSFVALVVSIVLRFMYKMKIYMTYGALGIFIIAFWLLTDSFMFPFVFGVYHVNGVLNYLSCFMIPFAPAIYLNSVQRGRHKISVSVIMITAAVNGVLWPLLHFTGICPFYYIRTIVNIILVGMAVAAIVILVIDDVKGNVSDYRYTFVGFLGFLICCIIELSMILLTTTNESLPMVIGLAFLLVFVVIEQVDELRRTNLEKQRAIDVSEAKTRFLASMSHEIRTPINAILGMNEMILRENKDKVIGEYARNVKASGKMLLMLVNDVLDFSKIEAGKLEITQARFLVSEMLRDVVSLVKERADEKSLEFKTEITDEIPNEMISDEFRIRQILVNLIGNAVKYTEKGTVMLRLGGSYEGDLYNLHLVVKDTGKGIRKGDQKHLFEAFTRVDEKANANIEGTGLGLAIVKSIVDSMKGTLGVESEYGVGSEFWVKLPVKYVSKKPLPENFLEIGSESDGAYESCDFTAPEARILAVDDNQSNLTIVKLFLKRTGITPDLCRTGTRAAQLCREKKYDLILLDHMMPTPDGIETLHLIKSDAASLNRETKTVVLTANAVVGSRQKYLEEGFDDYLTKPLDAGLLEQTVRRMLPRDKVLLREEKDSAQEKTESAGEKVFDADEIVFDTALDKDFDEVEEGASPIRRRLASIDGLDYETALGYCAGEEELLEEIVRDIAKDGPERAERMRDSLAKKDVKAYGIEAHTIKSTMATIGLKAFSERAKQHEFAAKDNQTEFINKEAEDFIQAYLEICRKLEG